jgi:putative endonuclease
MAVYRTKERGRAGPISLLHRLCESLLRTRESTADNESNGPRHLKTGCWGEEEAARWLKAEKYKILGRRVRVGRHDELDIIARKNGVLVFVEVKTRRSEEWGRPFSAVNRAKRRNLSRAASAFLKKQKKPPDYFRFDVVEVVGEPGGGKPLVRHIENAFQWGGGRRPWW